jgi:hypothetical protein
MKHVIPLLLLIPLAACAAHPVPPSASVDDIMRRQYAADGPHGAMTGEEAGTIHDAYIAHIGAAAPETPDPRPATGDGAMR